MPKYRITVTQEIDFPTFSLLNAGKLQHYLAENTADNVKFTLGIVGNFDNLLHHPIDYNGTVKSEFVSIELLDDDW